MSNQLISLAMPLSATFAVDCSVSSNFNVLIMIRVGIDLKRLYLVYVIAASNNNNNNKDTDWL